MHPPVQAVAATAPEIYLRGVSTSRGGTRALRRLTLAIAPGSFHGILGASGAGKSTLLHLISASLRPTEGTVLVNRQLVPWRGPADARRHGVVLIPQAPHLVPGLTVLDTALNAAHVSVWVSPAARRATRERIESLATSLDLDLRTPVEYLNPGAAQRLEVLKALAWDARVVCVDDPLAALDGRERDLVMNALTAHRARGASVILASRSATALATACETVSLLRDGTLLDTVPAAECAERVRQAEREVPSPRPTPPPALPPATGESLVWVHEASDRQGRIRGLNLALRAGEIVGLAGLAGSGRTTLLRSLYGDRPLTEGLIRVDVSSLHRHGIRDAIGAGIGFIPAPPGTPAERERALVPGRPVLENVALTEQSDGHPLAVVWPRGRARVREALAQLGLAGLDLERPAEELSAGEARRAQFARWLLMRPNLLLVDEPTRGVDAESRAIIYDVLRAIAAGGAAVVVASDDTAELSGLCSRTLLLRDGAIVAEHDPVLAGADLAAEVVRPALHPHEPDTDTDEIRVVARVPAEAFGLDSPQSDAAPSPRSQTADQEVA
ncbi:sugar ABC transporter ATP-binding protein [Micrococcales bacterium 31B]|nr:sugar ABC transporter ATP-binding protein [Micrococcales bacterium 31B]